MGKKFSTSIQGPTYTAVHPKYNEARTEKTVCGIKYPERIINYSKGCISLMFAATADGKLLAPYVVYKSENLWLQWCKDEPDGTRYIRSKSGWFDSISFLVWFKNIVIPWASKLDGQKLVIGDNYAIYSDSRSALDTVSRGDSLHPLAVRARENIKNIEDQGGSLALYWVKAHAGLTGNEKADHLAKEATVKVKTLR